MIEDKPYYSFYHACKVTVRTGLKLFYRKWQIEGYEHLHVGQPMLMGSNHQNAFIDPLNIVCATEKRLQPTFLTRSDVFTRQTKGIFARFKMLPIYRQRDGVDTVTKNKEIFEKCVRRLSLNESIIIFAEGNHGLDYRIRPLQKGFARIGFQAAEHLDFKKEIFVQPVGINYSAHTRFRSNMLLIFGPGFSLAPYYEQFQGDERKTLVAVRDELSRRLKEVVIHIARPNYDIINPLRTWASDYILSERKGDPRRLYDRFLGEKAFIAKAEAYLAHSPDQKAPLLDLVQAYTGQLEEIGFEDEILAKFPGSWGRLGIEALLVVLGFPLFLYGWINHGLVYHLAGYYARKLFKDPAFHSSMKFLFGLLGYPLTYLLQTALVWALVGGPYALAYVITLPILGNFAFVYGRGVTHWWKRLKLKLTLGKADDPIHQALEHRRKIDAIITRIWEGQPVTNQPQMS